MTDFLIALTVAVILHEMAHAVIAKKLGAVIAQIILTPFGGALNVQTKILTSQQKCYVYLAGPVASLLFSLLFGVLVWLFPTIFIYLEYLVAANFFVGVINLLPIYPLDGGKILSQYMSTKVIFIWSDIVFVVVLVVALIMFNWWWIFFAVVILIQINWDFKQSLYADKFSYRSGQKTGQFVRCAVLSNTTLFEAYKMIDKKHPTEFVVTDKNNQSFFESDLEQWLLQNSADTLLKQCF
ncbi:MAG: site-2 protease family protein [Clostridia bacterium]|nr:site-2 protease family protein [Clostridia bacterium]